MKLVFATNNQHKVNEVQQLLPDGIQLLSLKDIGCTEDIAETETTLEGNAILKANYVTENYGYDCFADDTGLEVLSLNGAPGVYSARYAGEHGNAEKNMKKLLDELNGKTNRFAQFRTCVALNFNGKKLLFQGMCEGEILQRKRGKQGFGYDPLFLPIGYKKSFAEMEMEIKNTISHRARAIKKLVDYLISYH